jgi:hypothetical protein
VLLQDPLLQNLSFHPPTQDSGFLPVPSQAGFLPVPSQDSGPLPPSQDFGQEITKLQNEIAQLKRENEILDVRFNVLL